MNAFIIDTKNLVCKGAHNTVEQAEAVALKGKYDFTIITDEADACSLLTLQQITTLYNHETGQSKEFLNQEIAAQLLLEKLNLMEVKTMTTTTDNPEKKTVKKVAKKVTKKPASKKKASAKPASKKKTAKKKASAVAGKKKVAKKTKAKGAHTAPNRERAAKTLKKFHDLKGKDGARDKFVAYAVSIGLAESSAKQRFARYTREGL